MAQRGTLNRSSGSFLWEGALGRAAGRSLQVLLVMLLGAVLVFALVQVRLVIIPLLLALILASAIGPFVSWLRRKGCSSSVATASAFTLLLLCVGALATGVVIAVIGQTDILVIKAAQGANQLLDLVQNGPIPVSDAQLQAARDAVVDFVTSSTAGSTALAGLSAATTFLTGSLLTMVILFFFLKDGEKIWAFILRFFRDVRLVKARRVGDQALSVLGGYVRGTAIIAAVDAFFIGAALVILQVPLAVPLAIIVFIGSFIPLVGATLAGALATVVALVTNGPVTALIVVGVVILVNQLEGNFLQPVVMGHTLSVHPLVILVALTAGTVLAGIIGAILAVPLTAVAWAGIKAWNAESDHLITDDQILLAETHTLMDEQGHGPSTLPENGAGEPVLPELPEINPALLTERSLVAPRHQSLDPDTQDPTTGEPDTGEPATGNPATRDPDAEPRP